MRYLPLVLVVSACGPVPAEDPCEPILLHVDADGDGFGAGPEVSACPGAPGHSPNALDCADHDPRAFPGQTEWQSIPIAGPAHGLVWDFNCDGQEHPRWRDSGTYCWAGYSNCAYTGGINHPDGTWLIPYPATPPRGLMDIPACGAVGTWSYSCSKDTSGVCVIDSEMRVQACL